MLRTAIWFIYFVVYLIVIYPKLLMVKQLDKQGKQAEHDQLTYRTAKTWAQALLNVAGVTVKITGEEKIPKDTTVLFVSNHQGNFDIPLLLAHIERPKAFIAKIELLKIPLIRSWMTHMKCVFMDRADIKQSLRVINQATEYLKEGYSMVIFPEGTRSKGNTIGEFKAGSLKLALKAGVPIIPITIRGSYKIMEANGSIIKPAEVEILIHDPLSTSGLSKEEAKELPDKVRKIIEQGLYQ